MKTITKLSLLTLLCANPSTSLGATFVTVGIYDEATETNTVDTDITGTLGTFTTDVAAAFANNRGGVINFQSGFSNSGSNTNIGTTFDTDYGTSAAKTLAFTSSAAIEIWQMIRLAKSIRFLTVITSFQTIISQDSH